MTTVARECFRDQIGTIYSGAFDSINPRSFKFGERLGQLAQQTLSASDFRLDFVWRYVVDG
jgi:hypothetical protein